MEPGRLKLASESDLDAAIAFAKAKLELEQNERYRLFEPYDPQIEFLNLSAIKRELLFMAGTQTGKTKAGGYCAAMHLTGLYPDWYTGKRFKHPIRMWVGGEGGRIVRDRLQNEMLLGATPGEEGFGTGFIKRDLIIDWRSGHGESGLLDSFRVRHVTGGASWCGLKTYDQGRGKWQSDTLDLVWVDEEPPDDVYGEAVSRLTGEGFIFVTCTPLEGSTEFIRRFTQPSTPEAAAEKGVVRMGLRHAKHFTEEEKRKRLAGYSASQRRARENGDPVLDAGAIWEGVDETDILTNIRMSQVPEHWVKLWGLDFGIGHPFAAVLIAWDKDADVIYVLDCFKMSGGIPLTHAARIKNIASGVLCAWPHDGGDREKSTGLPLSKSYADQGLLMRPSHATHPAGGYSTEAGINEMLNRMRDGRFKVAAHLADWLDEFRTYHRDEHGKIVKTFDDLMSATRIAVMDRRFGTKASLGSIVVTHENKVIRLPGAEENYWGFDR